VIKQDKKPSPQPSARYKHICLPFESEQQYGECVADPGKYRAFLTAQFKDSPELFPSQFSEGYQFHSHYQQKKQDLVIRRVKLKATEKVFSLRPSFVMPYAVARTEKVEKALHLRGDGVAFETLVEVYGRDINYWERMWLSLGRNSLLGTSVKAPDKLPAQLVADEKVTWLNGAEVLVATTVSEGCFLGAALARDESAAALTQAYGEFKQEAQELDPNYAPESVCTDGFKSTRLAWQDLFPTICLILCFLHGVLKIRDRCRGELRKQVLKCAWHCYRAATPRQFSQRLRRLREWAARNLTGAVLEAVEKLHANRDHYQMAYQVPDAYRTTNAVDRLMNQQDRLLYAMRYLHGDGEKARLALRAMALQWNFHPYSARVRREDPTRKSPFADLNGFQYHDHWLHNLLIAASLGGHQL